MRRIYEFRVTVEMDTALPQDHSGMAGKIDRELAEDKLLAELQDNLPWADVWCTDSYWRDER